MNDKKPLTLEDAKKKIKELTGTHLLIYAGDGNGRPKDLLFSTGQYSESAALCDLLIFLLDCRLGKAP